MKKQKRVTVTKTYIDYLKDRNKDLKDRNKDLEKSLDEIRDDRKIHRDFYLSLLRDVIEIHGKGQSIGGAWLILRLSQHLNKVERWWWQS